jgi:transcriptional regulator with XRE-family HTH domain
MKQMSRYFLFGQKLRELRERAGVSQAELAGSLGYKQRKKPYGVPSGNATIVWRMEHGVTSGLDRDMVSRIAEELLVGDDERDILLVAAGFARERDYQQYLRYRHLTTSMKQSFDTERFRLLLSAQRALYGQGNVLACRPLTQGLVECMEMNWSEPSFRMTFAPVYAQLLGELADMLGSLGYPQQSLDMSSKVMLLVKEYNLGPTQLVKESRKTAEVWYLRGKIEDLQRAKSILEQAIVSLKRRISRFELAQLRMMLAIVLTYLEPNSPQIDYFAIPSLEVLELGGHDSLPYEVAGLAEIRIQQGRLEESIGLTERVYTTWFPSIDQQFNVGILLDMAEIRALTGDTHAAMQYLDQVERLAGGTGHKWGLEEAARIRQLLVFPDMLVSPLPSLPLVGVAEPRH